MGKKKKINPGINENPCRRCMGSIAVFVYVLALGFCSPTVLAENNKNDSRASSRRVEAQ